MELVTLTKIDGDLKIELTPEGRKELQSWPRSEHSDYDLLRMLLESHFCNGWDEIQPVQIGALTSGMILSDEAVFDQEDGREIVECGRVYWHQNYETEDAIESLMKGGLWMLGYAVEIGGEGDQ